MQTGRVPVSGRYGQSGEQQVIPTAIQMEGVSFGFNGTELFENFSCTIAAGKTTCLLGPSGCGKSTLLRLISGAAISGEGRVCFGPDRPRQEVPVSWMAQEDLLLPWLSVLDNVMLGAKLRGETDSSLVEKALSLLARAGLQDSAGSLPRELSGGMRQRVALLRTLMEERPVILMDEPFSALDALTRMNLQDLAVEMTRGRTVLLVTHDPLEALRIGDFIMVLGGAPVRVREVVEMTTPPPRMVQDPEVAAAHQELLQLVMGEGGA